MTDSLTFTFGNENELVQFELRLRVCVKRLDEIIRLKTRLTPVNRLVV